MRILFLQDKLYYPTFGGGVKAIRLLLEGLAARGHACASVGPMLASRAGPATEQDSLDLLRRRGTETTTIKPGVRRYRLAGVDVDAMNLQSRDEEAARARDRIHEFEPDWVIVSDDRHGRLLEWALAAAPDRVLTLLQTVIHLPFGPFAYAINEQHQCQLGQVRAILTISRFLQDYLLEHGGLASVRIAPPVYGEGPFPSLGRFDRGYVTLINPCVEKGLPIFAELARRLPAVEFAAVPTWGADAAVHETLAAMPNVRVLEPADDIDAILSRTRILLAPSLWPETFGYVVPEAMLRGIPALASNVGGLPEATLGVGVPLPVKPASLIDGRYSSPPQDVKPWEDALLALLTDRAHYERRRDESRAAALAHLDQANARRFESLLRELAQNAQTRGTRS